MPSFVKAEHFKLMNSWLSIAIFSTILFWASQEFEVVWSILLKAMIILQMFEHRSSIWSKTLIIGVT